MSALRLDLLEKVGGEGGGRYEPTVRHINVGAFHYSKLLDSFDRYSRCHAVTRMYAWPHNSSVIAVSFHFQNSTIKQHDFFHFH